jgi:hypothetical protein
MNKTTLPGDSDNQLTRELKELNKNLKESSDLTNRLSFVIFVLAFIQAFMVSLQIIFIIQEAENKMFGYFLLFMLAIGGAYIFNSSDKLYKKIFPDQGK